jgi:hypothetical protein
MFHVEHTRFDALAGVERGPVVEYRAARTETNVSRETSPTCVTRAQRQ